MNYFINYEKGTTVCKGSNKVIANFYVKLKGINEYICEDNAIHRRYVLEFYNPEYVCEAEVDTDELEKLDYSSINDMLLLAPTVGTAGKEMAFCIKSQSKDVEPKKIYFFSKLGWHLAESKHFYCAGDRVISDSSSATIKIDEYLSKKYHLEIDNTLSELDAVEWVSDFIKINKKVCSVLFATGLEGTMRQLIIDAGIRVPCVTFVHGESQTRKTTTVNLGTQMYNRSELQSGISPASMRVSSTEYKAEELADELKDTTFLYDDLYQETSSRQHNIHVGRVRNLIRNFADNSSRTTTRSAFKNNSQIIITAEKLFKSKTDLGRTLLLHVKKPINSEKLSKCQENMLALSTFYYYFIKWICSNYETIVHEMKAKFNEFKAKNRSVDYKYGRLCEQYFIMCFVVETFIKYIKEKGYTEDGDKLMRMFQKKLKGIIEKQYKIMDSLEFSEKKDVNFSAEFYQLKEEGLIKVGKKGSECFEKSDKIYITSKYFVNALKEKYEVIVTANKISGYFKNKYISEVYSDNRNKKYNNIRYMILDKKELKRDAKDIASSYEDLFF